MNKVPVSEKYTLKLTEVAAYFNIGEKKILRLAREQGSRFAVFNGNRCLIIRTKFEQFLDQTSSI